MTFRDKFYKNYFQTQASRVGAASIKNKIVSDQIHLLKEIIPLLPVDKNSKILDMGCGYGSLLLLLKKKGYSNTTGIDISEDQVKLARELGADNITQDDIVEHLKAHESVYGAIIGIDVVEHFEKAELMDLLEKVKASLKSGGIVVLRTPNCDAPFGSIYCFGDFTHGVCLNYFSAKQVLLSAGFKKIQISSSYFRTEGLFKNLIRSIIWPFIALACKITLFASGKSVKNVLLSPNMIIKAEKE